MIIELKNVSVAYDGVVALGGIDLVASPGAILGVLGPNGSGKSSLIKAIAGLVPTEGLISFDGARARPRTIAYMPQEIGGNAALTVLETVLLGRLRRLGLKVAKSDLEAVATVLAAMKLSDLGGRHLGELSGGQRQMVFLAQALAAEPEALLLDEPISALDLRNQLEVIERVRELTTTRRLTTICVLHDINAAARVCDRVALLQAGRLVAAGPPHDVITPATLAAGFGVEVEILSGGNGAPLVNPLRPIRQ